MEMMNNRVNGGSRSPANNNNNNTVEATSDGSYSGGVRQLMNGLAHIINGVRRIKTCCSTGLLTDEHETKVQYLSKSSKWADQLYKEMKEHGAENVTPAKLKDILADHQAGFTQAIAALSGPHVGIIAAIKLSAYQLTSKKNKKNRKESVNDILNKALKAVNAVNAVWYSMTHINDFLWDIIRFLPSDTEDEVAAKEIILGARSVITDAIKKAQSFSDNARMVIAEECLKRNFVVPSGKHFRGLTKEQIFQAGPVLRSEVVFKVSGKALGKVSKKQPMRLSVFGNLLVLTESTLKAEKLVMPPKPLQYVQAGVNPGSTDDVLRLDFTEGTQPCVLRSKVPAQRDRWLNFFSNGEDEVKALLKKNETFQGELSTPSHPKLAARPSMVELSLFNQARKSNLAATSAWDNDDEIDDEAFNSDQVFVSLGDVSSGPENANLPDMNRYCSPAPSRCVTPMATGSRSATPVSHSNVSSGTRYTPSPMRMCATPRTGTPVRASPVATRSTTGSPASNWVTFDSSANQEETEAPAVHDPFVVVADDGSEGEGAEDSLSLSQQSRTTTFPASNNRSHLINTTTASPVAAKTAVIVSRPVASKMHAHPLQHQSSATSV